MRQVAAILLVAAALGISGANVARGRYAMGDFKAFYCSARVVLQHGDLYAAAPMARCERQPARYPLYVTQPGEVVPAPLPGYAIALFVPFALLPFDIAAFVWIVLLAAAFAVAVALFAKTGAGDGWAIAVALALPMVAVCFPVGELPPIALLGIALAAWSARYGRPWALALGVAFALVEPQIGAAVLLAAVALGRRFAIPAIAVAAILGLVSLTLLGVAGNVAYFRVVLPAHLLSELPSVLQYSLSWMLYRIGVAAGAAIFAGRLCWIVMLGVTVWFARSDAARARPEIAFLAAPAFAVVGGPFLHLDQIALAVPAAAWLATNALRPSWLRTAALVALAVPVLYVFSVIRLVALAPFVGAWLAATSYASAIVGIRTALLTIVVLSLIGGVAILTGTGSMHAPPVQTLPATLPQAAWAQYIGKHFIMTSWSLWLVKAPIWLAIAATAAGLVSLARAPKGAAA